MLYHGDCMEIMKTLPDKSVDLFICDLPYGQTNCKWDTPIDLDQFWKEVRRLKRSKNVTCIMFCTTPFGFRLIQSNEKEYKMDLVWLKRNITGGLQSRYRPMRNHEMLYFFYDKSPKYNRDKYHKRVGGTADKSKIEREKNPKKREQDGKFYGKCETPYADEKFTSDKVVGGKLNNFFDPPNPRSVVEEKNNGEVWGWGDHKPHNHKHHEYEPSNPVSVVEETAVVGGWVGAQPNMDRSVSRFFDPPNPNSVFKSGKVFIGKRNHQTEKPIDILEFLLKYWSDEGDTILDPTMGSGSTGVACKNLKREFIGIELDEKYFEVAKKRIDDQS